MSDLRYEKIVALQQRREVYHELLKTRPEFSWLWHLKLRAIQLQLQNPSEKKDEPESRRPERAGRRPASGRRQNSGRRPAPNSGPSDTQPPGGTKLEGKVRSKTSLRSLLTDIQTSNDESRDMQADDD
jgi:hypothetical protein